MAILACAVPAFPIALLARTDAAVLDRPLALLGPDDRVIDFTPPAQAAGVAPGQTPRQARTCCPDLTLRPADLPACHAEFDALLTLLDDFSGRVEPAGLGRAYLDAPGLDEQAALAFCRQLGQQVRREFGAALQPAVGCDSGKFTAHAAAGTTRPGAIRVVLGPAEQPFLRPLPVRMLPLSDDNLLRLGYLGIRLLGQYADLPSRAILQQFGPAGRLAQRWAQGRDDRPVIPRQQRPTLAAAAEFDPPLETAPALAEAAARLLQRPLAQLRDRLQGAQVLVATRTWAAGGSQEDRWALPAPTADPRRVRQLLAGRWEQGAWDSAVAGLTLTLREIQDQVARQLTLFQDAGGLAALQGEWDEIRRLRVRYGPGRLLRALVRDPLALRVERRVLWQEAVA